MMLRSTEITMAGRNLKECPAPTKKFEKMPDNPMTTRGAGKAINELSTNDVTHVLKNSEGNHMIARGEFL
ncbi:MAG: hypothetical protein JSR96_04235 [Proteobacteria bacterium]|nr:hypothetical protein [Pseudomonadota bacterium]